MDAPTPTPTPRAIFDVIVSAEASLVVSESAVVDGGEAVFVDGESDVTGSAVKLEAVVAVAEDIDAVLEVVFVGSVMLKYEETKPPGPSGLIQMKKTLE